MPLIPCAACNAEADEDCRPGCIGLAAHEDALKAEQAAKVVGYVTQDAYDGFTWSKDVDNERFTLASAQAFCDERNAGLQPEHQSYRVLALVTL